MIIQRRYDRAGETRREYISTRQDTAPQGWVCIGVCGYHEKERKAAMQDDEYLYQMFNYELANHEYSYTYDLTDTLEALDLTIDEINADPRMADALKRAIAAQED
jgi:hypothetical protein